jgi:hypothetical protein
LGNDDGRGRHLGLRKCDGRRGEGVGLGNNDGRGRRVHATMCLHGGCIVVNVGTGDGDGSGVGGRGRLLGGGGRERVGNTESGRLLRQAVSSAGCEQLVS